MLKRNEIIKVLEILRKEYDQSTTALKYNSPFQLLVSTILAAQSTDKQVNKITETLFKDFPDAESFLRLSLEDLENKIRSIGLYRNKARNIMAAAQMLVTEYGGEVPENREVLIKLPGVGRKTANVVLSVGFKHDAIAVDTHVFRVSNRIGLAKADDVEKTEEHLMQNIPQPEWSAAHHWLIWHGRQVCKARNPKCEVCPLGDYCCYFRARK